MLQIRNACVPFFGFSSSITNVKSFCHKVASSVYTEWKKKFENSNIDEPSESIRHILSHVVKSNKILDKHDLRNVTLNTEHLKQICELCQQRLKRMPIQYIISEWDFRNLTLKMQPPVFIPRPETEILVDLVLKEIRDEKLRSVLDLCCGSGAIALSLLNEDTQVEVTAVDQSEKACHLTSTNAERHKLSSRLRIIKSKLDIKNKLFVQGEQFDVVVSNPPYVFSQDMYHLQDEIKLYEDLEALDGGDEGMNVIKAILSLSSQVLKNKRKMFLEVDPRHPDIIRRWLQFHNYLGLSLNEVHKDFSGKNRFVVLMKLF